MPTTMGSVRRRLLTPRLSEVTFAKRGFPAAPSAGTRLLEAIPQAVICGFEWGIDARDQWGRWSGEWTLVAAEQRGFAYEGVTMAFTVLDAMGRGHRTRDLLAGPGSRHIFLAYIGMGFAMSHLPRPLWKKVVPDLTGDPYYPTMSWLAVDGYGFDRAYFDTPRWVDAQKVPAPYRWEGSPDSFPPCGRPGHRACAVVYLRRSRTGCRGGGWRFASYRQPDLTGVASAWPRSFAAWM